MNLRAIAVWTVTLLAASLISSTAFAWKALSNQGCSPSKFALTPRIKIQWAETAAREEDGDPTFSEGEKTVIRAALEQYNHLPNANVYFYEDYSTNGCWGGLHMYLGIDQEDYTICIQKTDSGDTGEPWVGNAHRGDPDSSCRHKFCEIRLGNEDVGTWLKYLYTVTSHEVAHCLGVEHTNNNRDWMASVHSLNSTYAHTGMSRDTLNAINYNYPVATNYYVGNFSGGDDGILTRDNMSTGDTIPWYLTTNGFGDVWNDAGQVMPDFGNETTLAFLTGDFNGDGCTDVARGLCDGCEPGDGDAETVPWTVKTSNCASGFNAATTWSSDFGNAEDYDQYRVGDFDGDGCDDIWLIRNTGTTNCVGGSTCTVQIWWMLARRPNGVSCASSGSPPDHFVTHTTQFSIPVVDRNAPSVGQWVVGDFATGNGLGCADIAFGTAEEQEVPYLSVWRVLRGKDTNSNGLCDTLADDGVWGHSGTSYALAGNVDRSGADDLITVSSWLSPGVQSATWYVHYSNGTDAFDSSSTALSDFLITGSEEHWTNRVYRVGNFDKANGSDVDFLAIRGANSTGPVKAQIAYQTSVFGAAWQGALGSNVALPTAQAAWNQTTDEDNASALDNGGKDVRETWWGRFDNVAFCEKCTGTGCCP